MSAMRYRSHVSLLTELAFVKAGVPYVSIAYLAQLTQLTQGAQETRLYLLSQLSGDSTS